MISDLIGDHMLLTELRRAREGKGLSRRDLAAKLDCTEQAIKRLENGQATTGLLVKAMQAVDFHVAGLSKGWLLNDQLSATRIRKGLSISELARQTGLSRQSISAIEAHRGSVQTLLRILEVLGPEARPRQPMARVSWQYDPKGLERDVRFTPPWLLAEINAVFGDIDLDPCGHAGSSVVAKRVIEWAKGGDGLTEDWSGAFAFVNPPFSAMLKWLKRAEDEWRRGHVEQVFALVPARLDSTWVHDRLAKFADIWIIRGRLRFWTEAGQGNQAPFGVMAVFMGVPPEQILEFIKRVPGNWFAPRPWVGS